MAEKLGSVVRHIRHMAAREALRHLGDAELLRRFMTERDEGAFAVLVHRHGPLVYGVCRRVLGHEQDAEDSFQASFVLLAQKAGSIHTEQPIGSWLYGVAYRMAMNAKRKAARRWAHEKQAVPQPQSSLPSDASLREFQVILDEEVARLPEKQRAPFLLCCLEGKTRTEAARELAWKKGTVASRLNRARAELRRRLTKRGVTTSAALAAGVTAAMPAGLAAATVEAAAASLFTPAGMRALSAPVAGLVKGLTKTALLSKVKIAMGVLLAVGILGGWAGAVTHNASEERQKGRTPPIAKAHFDDAPLKEPASQERDGNLKQIEALLKDALNSIDAMTDRGALPHRLLADIAVFQHELGQSTAAAKTMQRARDIVDAMPADDSYWEYRVLAWSYAKMGDIDAVLALAKIIPDRVRNGKEHEFRDMVLQEAGERFAETGQETQAMQVADLINNKETQRWVRTMLLQKAALFLAGQGKMREALATVDRMPGGNEQVMALAGVVYFNLGFGDDPSEPGIAMLQAKAGDQAAARQTLQKAITIAKDISEEKGKARALTAIACVQARWEEFANARKTAADITNPVGKDIALGAIYKALGLAGKSKEALQIIDQMPKDASKVYALYHLAAGQAKAGDQKGAKTSFKQAVSILTSCSEQDRRSHGHNLASEQAIAGYFEDAKETAKLFCGDGELPLTGIAYSQAEAGDFKAAVETASAAPIDGWWRGNTFQSIAHARTERGDAQGAIEWARELTPSDLRANALFGIAKALAKRK